MPTYIEKIDASDLTLAGGTATRDLSTPTGTNTNFNVAPANAGGQQTHFFLTLAGVPNSDAWESDGTQTVEIEVDNADADIDCDVRIGRCDSTGTILQTGSFVGAQDMGATRSFSPVAPTWTGGEEACGNRYFVELLFTNNAAHGAHSVDVGVGTTANEVVTDITEDSAGCTVVTQRYETRVIREAKGYVRPRAPPKSSVLKQTFPPPVFERVQSRQMRVALSPARHVPAPSARIQVFAPPPPAPPENYFTRVLRTVFAPSRHLVAPSTRWKTFPPPIFERVQSRLMRVVFAKRKRSPGQGQVLKQTFPPPVFERIQSRLIRVALATRRRWQAPSKKVQVLAPPPPPPPGGLIPFLRSFRLQGRDRKRSGRTFSRITFRMFIPPVPVVSALKRIGGWFRNFWRVG